jgi:hypothetical protein
MRSFRKAELVLVLLVGLAINSRAVEPSTNTPATNTVEWVEQHRLALSEKVVDYVGRFDDLFGDESTRGQKNPTSLRVDMALRLDHDGHLSPKMAVKGSLALPQLEKRAHLVIDSLGKDYEPGEGPVEQDDTSFFAGVRGYLVNKPDIDLNLSSGIRWNNITPVLYVRLTGERTFRKDPWSFRVRQYFDYDSEDGFGETTNLRLGRPVISSNTYAAIGIGATWSETSSGVDHGETFFLSHYLSRNRSIHSEFGYTGHTRPTINTDKFRVEVSYKQPFFWQWLTASIAPEIEMPREDDYEIQPRLTFKLEILLDPNVTGRLADK